MSSAIHVEIAVLLIFLAIVLMQWFGKLPSMTAVRDLAAILNSRGGNILVLGSMAIFFFIIAVRFTYYVMAQSIGGKLDATDSLAMAAFTWITGSAFGGAFTSMVKAMTGEDNTPAPTEASTTITTVTAPPAPTQTSSTGGN